MKKSIIALMGLFTLVACSEDTYQEADQMTETVEHNSGGGIMPPTMSMGYDSPFQSFGSGSFNVLTTFRNTTPLFLELEPYGEDMHVQTFLSANSATYPPPPPAIGLPFSFSPIPSTSFVIPPGAVHINQDPGAPLSVNGVPPYSNPQGAIVYDFGNWSTNWRMYHYGKIYYFKYIVSDNIGNVIDAGYIKHNFYNDTDDYNDITMVDPTWQYVTTVSGFPATYDVVAMYHIIWDEMCLTNRNKSSTPLPSSVPVTNPATGTVHTLEFTSNSSGMNVNFM